MNLIKKVMTSILLAGSCLGMSANDPNFHIYLSWSVKYGG